MNSDNQVVYGPGSGAAQLINAGHVLGVADQADLKEFDEYVIVIPKADWNAIVGVDIFSNAEDRTLSKLGIGQQRIGD